QKKAGAGGYANLSTSLKMTPDQRMVVASMSKTITAAAVMRALEMKSMSLNDKVAPFLPSDWALGPHMSELTFRDLLKHLSGFRGENGGNNNDGPGDDGWYDGLKTAVAMGAADANWQVNQYHNANFALFRIIIAYMMKPRSELEATTNPFQIGVDAK